MIKSPVTPALGKRITSRYVLLLFMLTIGSMPGALLASAEVFDFSIPAQRADISLTEYARITGRKILFPYDLAIQYQASKVEGAYSADEAIVLLLAATDLLLTTSDQGSMIIKLKNRWSEKSMKKLSGILGALIAALSGPQQTYAAENGKGFALEEIVVTARKREESLQDTPISVTAVGGDLLKEMGIQQISGVADLAPNVNFSFAGTSSGSGSAAVVFIRGVGQNDFLPTGDPGVGIYVDGVYLARSVGAVLDLADVQRIEVLRGPQGTLFGRNTIGGAISLITRDPGDELEGDIRVIAGEDNRRELFASVSSPLGENVSGLISVLSRQRDGTVDRPLDGGEMGNDDVWGVRGKLVWDINDQLSAKLSADYVKEDESSAAEVLIDVKEDALFAGFFNNNTFGSGTTDAAGCAGGGALTNPACYNDQFVGGEFTSFETGPNQSKIENKGAALELNYSVSDSLIIKSITAYRDLDALFSRSADGSPYTIFHTTDDYISEQFSQELQFIGSGDHFNWVSGLYYFKEEAEDFAVLNSLPPNFPQLTGGVVENENWALYGEGTYDISDTVHLTTGLRYTDETKNFTPSTLIVNAGTHLIPAVPQPELGFSETTWRVSLGWDISEQLTSYLTVSEGFKSGGYDVRVNRATVDNLSPTYNPEFVRLYEVGLKGEFTEQGLRFSLAYFQSDYDDIQTASNPPGQIGTVTFNAATGEINGVEFEMQWVPTNRLLIQGSIGYQDASYGETGSALVSRNDEFIRTPELAWNLGVSYQVPLEDNGTITSRFDVVYKDEIHFEPVNDESVKSEDYTVLNLSTAWQDASEKWKVTLGVNNVTDKKYIVAADSNGTLGYALAIYARPRNGYVSLDYTF